MDLSKNIRTVFTFLNAENLHCYHLCRSDWLQVAHASPHFHSCALHWKRFLFDTCSCTSKTQMHEWGSGSVEIISGWLDSSNILNREEEKGFGCFFSKSFKDKTIKIAKHDRKIWYILIHTEELPIIMQRLPACFITWHPKWLWFRENITSFLWTGISLLWLMFSFLPCGQAGQGLVEVISYIHGDPW